MDPDRDTACRRPRAELTARLAAHLRAHPAAVVALTGQFGAGHRDVIAEAGRASTILECSSRRTSPHTLVRRLDVFDYAPGASAADAAGALASLAGPKADGTVHFVPCADRLDEDSLRVLDVLVHAGEGAVVLAGATVPDRYTEALASPRGLIAELDALTEEDAREIVRRHAGADPTARCLEYLIDVSGGLHRLLVAAVRLGLSERWLVCAEDRTVIGGPPVWMDRLWAAGIRDEIADVVPATGLRVLEQAALAGRVPLRSLVADPDLREGAHHLERSGLVDITAGDLGVRLPAVRTALGMGSTEDAAAVSWLGSVWRTAVADEEPGRSPLMAHMCGVKVADDELMRGSLLEFTSGHIHHALALLDGVETPSPRSWYARAVIEATIGRPRAALDVLRRVSGRAGTDLPVVSAEAEAVAQYIRAVCFRIEESTFTSTGTVDPAALGPGVGELYGTAVAIRRFNEAAWSLHGEANLHGSSVTPDGAAVDVSAATRGAAAPVHDVGSTEADRMLGRRAGSLADTCERVAAMLLAALGDRQDEARGHLSQLDEVDWPGLPALGMAWCLERVALARMIMTFDADLVPAHWSTRETASRRVLRSTSAGVFDLVSGVLRCEPAEELRTRLSTVWAEFATRLPAGLVSRALVEALDFVVEGERTQGLVGPPGAGGTTTEKYAAEPVVTLVNEIGRLLRCAPSELLRERIFRAHRSVRPVRRLLVRTVVLHRSPALSEEVCADLAHTAGREGVEPEFIALLDARAAGDRQAYERARAEALSLHPRIHLPSLPLGSVRPGGEERLRQERLGVLSPREQDIARRLVRGESTAAIAESLGIAVRTAQTHVSNAYRKLAVHSRTELRAELVM